MHIGISNGKTQMLKICIFIIEGFSYLSIIYLILHNRTQIENIKWVFLYQHLFWLSLMRPGSKINNVCPIAGKLRSKKWSYWETEKVIFRE